MFFICFFVLLSSGLVAKANFLCYQCGEQTTFPSVPGLVSCTRPQKDWAKVTCSTGVCVQGTVNGGNAIYTFTRLSLSDLFETLAMGKACLLGCNVDTLLKNKTVLACTECVSDLCNSAMPTFLNYCLHVVIAAMCSCLVYLI